MGVDCRLSELLLEIDNSFKTNSERAVRDILNVENESLVAYGIFKKNEFQQDTYLLSLIKQKIKNQEFDGLKLSKNTNKNFYSLIHIEEISTLLVPFEFEKIEGFYRLTSVPEGFDLPSSFLEYLTNNNELCNLTGFLFDSQIKNLSVLFEMKPDNKNQTKIYVPFVSKRSKLNVYENPCIRKRMLHQFCVDYKSVGNEAQNKMFKIENIEHITSLKY